ncbi:MAG: hypothetical protein J5382_03765 [Bacteroidales bacterium]|nr:hypothetical protein [Bacteroidales bacterium]
MQEPIENLKIRLASVGNPVIHVPVSDQISGRLLPDDLRILYNVSVEVNRPNSRVSIDVSLTYIARQLTLFSGSLTTAFDVVDLASYITEEEGKDQFRIENDFLPMLIGIAFSTTRGYFVRELQESDLAPYPFPMIPMDSVQKRTTYQLI